MMTLACTIHTTRKQTLFLNGGNSKYLRTGHLSTISQVRTEMRFFDQLGDYQVESMGGGSRTAGSSPNNQHTQPPPTSKQQLFPTFSLATIRGAGHWVHAEKPEETLQMVQRYLDEEMDL